MNVGALGLFLFVKSRDKVLVVSKNGIADRADPAAVSINTIYTARNMHKPFFSVKRRKGRGFNPFTVFKPGAADRAGSGRAGKTFAAGFTPAPAVKNRESRAAGEGEKECIAEPQKEYSGKGKKKYLNDDPHVLMLNIVQFQSQTTKKDHRRPNPPNVCQNDPVGDLDIAVLL
jgi:hypothetical protein